MTQRFSTCLAWERHGVLPPAPQKKETEKKRERDKDRERDKETLIHYKIFLCSIWKATRRGKREYCVWIALVEILAPT